MRVLVTIAGFVLMVAAAAWAYSENYRTRAAMDDLRQIETGLEREQEKIRMLEAEWAFLNRPERLIRLVNRYQGELGLQPLHPSQFGAVANVPFAAEAQLTSAE
ncbi:cell division protein FtsL [Paracoccaceae bacterium GXU_MW_L88]